MSHFQTICQIDNIPSGEARMFVVDEIPVGVFHIDGKFFALHNECPHAGASLAHGLIDGEVVSCRIHHWRFCIRDGTYIDQDRPDHNAKTIPLRVVGNEVQVDLSID